MPKNMDHVQGLPTIRLSDAELIAIFPEAKYMISEKLKELAEDREKLVSTIKNYLGIINTNVTDEFSRWFWREWIKLNEGQDLLAIDRQITKLHRQLRIARGIATPEGALSDDLIQAAREVPIETILNQTLRRTGRTSAFLCPFHEEQRPSFHIYTKENRGWCFGCNQGGDSISITMKLNSCRFKEAVLSLTGGRS